MKMKRMKKGRTVNGDNYVEVDEEYDREEAKKNMKKMKTAGIARSLKRAEKEEGYSKKPKVKSQKKGCKAY